jgi:predicted nucleotidyltransferase
MDWSSPTAAFIPGLDGVVLWRLYQVDGLQSPKEVHERAGVGSLNGIRYALARLVDQGVVESEAVGNTVGYQLNRLHVAFPAIDAAFSALNPLGELTARLRALANRFVPEASGRPDLTLAIYGSVARREAGTDSDVDLVLVIPDDDVPSHVTGDSLTDAIHVDVLAWTGNRAHVYRTSPRALRRAVQDGDPITRSWERDAITVYGRDLRDLIKEAK